MIFDASIITWSACPWDQTDRLQPSMTCWSCSTLWLLIWIMFILDDEHIGQISQIRPEFHQYLLRIMHCLLVAMRSQISIWWCRVERSIRLLIKRMYMLRCFLFTGWDTYTLLSCDCAVSFCRVNLLISIWQTNTFVILYSGSNVCTTLVSVFSWDNYTNCMVHIQYENIRKSCRIISSSALCAPIDMQHWER